MYKTPNPEKAQLVQADQLLELANCFINIYYRYLGFSGGTNSIEPTCQCRRHKRCEFDPWVGKIPWRRK